MWRGYTCGYFAHDRRLGSEDGTSEPLQTIHAILPGSKWSDLLTIVLQEAMSNIFHLYPEARARVYVVEIINMLKTEM